MVVVFVAVHGFSAPPAGCAVFVFDHEAFTRMLMLSVVAALVPACLAFCVLVVPLGCNFQHFWGALMLAACHNDTLTWIDRVDVRPKLLVFVDERLAW